jgi:cbb3-type cytochrome oxidase subunit 3
MNIDMIKDILLVALLLLYIILLIVIWRGRVKRQREEEREEDEWDNSNLFNEDGTSKYNVKDREDSWMENTIDDDN